jgi:hypothetical protein
MLLASPSWLPANYDPKNSSKILAKQIRFESNPRSAQDARTSKVGLVSQRRVGMPVQIGRSARKTAPSYFTSLETPAWVASIATGLSVLS